MSYPKNNNRNNNSKDSNHKKSFAFYNEIKQGSYKGHYIVNAGNSSKSKGFISVKLFPYEGTKKGTTKPNKKGKSYVRYMCELRYNRTGSKEVFPVLMNAESKVVTIDTLGKVITPNGRGMSRNGKVLTGYFGSPKIN